MRLQLQLMRLQLRLNDGRLTQDSSGSVMLTLRSRSAYEFISWMCAG